MSEIRLRADRLRWLETEGEVVVLDESTVAYLGLNASGAVIWKALAEGTTREQLVDLLTRAFEVGEEQTVADVEAFLAELSRRALLAD